METAEERKSLEPKLLRELNASYEQEQNAILEKMRTTTGEERQRYLDELKEAETKYLNARDKLMSIKCEDRKISFAPVASREDSYAKSLKSSVPSSRKSILPGGALQSSLAAQLFPEDYSDQSHLGGIVSPKSGQSKPDMAAQRNIKEDVAIKSEEGSRLGDHPERHKSVGRGIAQKRKRLPSEEIETQRSIAFHEVRRNASEYKIWDKIVLYQNNWYIFFCDEHKLGFKNKLPPLAAGKHLDSENHGNLGRRPSVAIAQIGYLVTGCTSIEVEIHNKEVDKANDDGYDPRSIRRTLKSGRIEFVKKAKKSINQTTAKTETSFEDTKQLKTLKKSQPVEWDSNEEDPFKDVRVRNPEQFAVYNGEWDGQNWPVLILGWDSQSGAGESWFKAGIPRSLNETGLLERKIEPPTCYIYKAGKIVGWADGYEDGGDKKKIDAREYPVMFFNAQRETAWMPWWHITEMKPTQIIPKIKDIENAYKEARSFIAHREGFESWEARELARLAATPGQLPDATEHDIRFQDIPDKTQRSLSKKIYKAIKQSKPHVYVTVRECWRAVQEYGTEEEKALNHLLEKYADQYMESDYNDDDYQNRHELNHHEVDDDGDIAMMDELRKWTDSYELRSSKRERSSLSVSGSREPEALSVTPSHSKRSIRRQAPASNAKTDIDQAASRIEMGMPAAKHLAGLGSTEAPDFTSATDKSGSQGPTKTSPKKQRERLRVTNVDFDAHKSLHESKRPSENPMLVGDKKTTDVSGKANVVAPLANGNGTDGKAADSRPKGLKAIRTGRSSAASSMGNHGVQNLAVPSTGDGDGRVSENISPGLSTHIAQAQLSKGTSSTSPHVASESLNSKSKMREVSAELSKKDKTALQTPNSTRLPNPSLSLSKLVEKPMASVPAATIAPSPKVAMGIASNQSDIEGNNSKSADKLDSNKSDIKSDKYYELAEFHNGVLQWKQTGEERIRLYESADGKKVVTQGGPLPISIDPDTFDEIVLLIAVDQDKGELTLISKGDDAAITKLVFHGGKGPVGGKDIVDGCHKGRDFILWLRAQNEDL